MKRLTLCLIILWALLGAYQGVLFVLMDEWVYLVNTGLALLCALWNLRYMLKFKGELE